MDNEEMCQRVGFLNISLIPVTGPLCFSESLFVISSAYLSVSPSIIFLSNYIFMEAVASSFHNENIHVVVLDLNFMM